VMNSIPKATNGIFSGCTTNISLALTDDSYVTTETGNYSPKFTSATYTRTSIKNQWGTLVVPFDVTIDNNNPYDFYAINSVTNSTIALTKLSGTLVAGTPVLIRMSEAAKDGDVYKDLQITEFNASVTNTINNPAAVDDIALTGSYNAINITGEDGYIIANNAFWSIQDIKGENKVYNAPFRAYLAYAPNAAKMLTININATDDDNDDATGINQLTTSSPLGELEGALDGALIYDLNGRRIPDLQKGINIVKRGGKTYKVLVK